MTLDYNQLKKDFLKKQKELDKQDTAKVIATAINKNKKVVK